MSTTKSNNADLAHMNGIEANLGAAPRDTFLRNAHPEPEAELTLANPPSNVRNSPGH